MVRGRGVQVLAQSSNALLVLDEGSTSLARQGVGTHQLLMVGLARRINRERLT